MAKKKKHSRKKSVYKEKKKQVVPATEVQGLSRAKASNSKGHASTPVVSQATKHEEIDREVAARAKREVRHSLTLAAAILLGLVGLWLLFAYTSVGAQIYKLVRL